MLAQLLLLVCLFQTCKGSACCAVLKAVDTLELFKCWGTRDDSQVTMLFGGHVF